MTVGKKKPNIIEVSFKKEEIELKYRIEMRCKFDSLSGWLKRAAYEKLEREEHPEVYYSNGMSFEPQYNFQRNPNINIPQNTQVQVDMPIDQNGVFDLLNMFQ